MSSHHAAVSRILAELARAKTQHPSWPVDPVHAAAIVAEESGELVRAVLNTVYAKGDIRTPDMMDDIREEAVQTAAMAIRFLENFDHYKFGASKSPQVREKERGPERKPCPFCGSDNIGVHVDGFGTMIYCLHCGGSCRDDRWNKRATTFGDTERADVAVPGIYTMSVDMPKGYNEPIGSEGDRFIGKAVDDVVDEPQGIRGMSRPAPTTSAMLADKKTS